MPWDAAIAARVRAYELMESAQGDAHEHVAGELLELEAEAQRHAWPEVAFLAIAGHALCAVLQEGDAAALARTLDALVARAETLGAPALVALALALRAIGAAERDDTASLLADAGRAVSLVDDESLDVLDRCAVLVVSGAAYNTLSLWELVAELYDRAALLEPACRRAVQRPAVAVNRVLLRLEWAAALFELGDTHEALEQLQGARVAAEAALDVEGLPSLWRSGVRACLDVLSFVIQAYVQSPESPVTPADGPSVDDRLAVLTGHLSALSEGGDVEMLPLMKALVALGLLQLGRTGQAEAAARLLRDPGSSSSGARSFPAWVRAQVLTGTEPHEGLAAHQHYARLVAGSRWGARQAVLAAARSKIADEGLSVEHASLARDVLLDPLTGLSNRRCFEGWLARIPIVERSTALVLIDLDDFKHVNDSYGHALGDEVLRRVGGLVAGHIRPGDMALRLGGDEFAVVLDDGLGADPNQPPVPLDAFERAATERAQALREAVASTDWETVAPGLSVRVSVGVAVASLGPDRPGAADRLYRQADAGLYAAKVQAT